jgi:hypothetical protein
MSHPGAVWRVAVYIGNEKVGGIEEAEALLRATSRQLTEAEGAPECKAKVATLRQLGRKLLVKMRRAERIT